MGTRRHASAISRLTLLLAGLLAIAVPSPASAQFHVAEPEVIKGQGQLADHGAVYAGPGTEEQLDQAHQLELFYGLTDRLGFLTVGLLQQPIGSGLEAQTYEIGGQYQLLKPEGEGFALAFRSLYQKALQEGDPDQVLFGPIAKLASRNISATLDTFFEQSLGAGNITGLDTKWRVKHRLGDRMSIGVEGYGKIKDIADPGSFNEQEHRVGPVVYFKFGPWSEQEFRDVSGVGEEKIWGASFGALFGLTEATSDIAFKFNLSGVF